LVGKANKQKKHVARKKKNHQTRKKEERKKKTDATCELCIQAFFCKCEQVVNMFKLQSWKNFLVHAHEIEFCHKIFQTCLKIQDKKVAMVQNSVVVFVNGRNQPRRAVYETSFFLGSITKTKTKTKTLAIFSSSNVYKGDRSVCISTVNFILVELRVGTKV
jgi:hypothetical protein